MVAIDYGQLEACTGAMCSLDKYLVKALWEDYDIHQEWAIKIATRMPALVGGKLDDKKVMKNFRSLVKNKMVFPAFFGASNESVLGYLCAGTGHDVPRELVDDIMDEFWSTFDGYKRWQDRLMKRYYEVGYVETLTGRRHHYPLTTNQAVNMPVQGTAAELVCNAMNRLSYMAATTDQWHLHPVLNVHDDLTFFVPDKDSLLEDALNVITREMLVFSYKWINVPLSVDVSIGKNWADLESIGKFWSHKDV
jgi:DNA polymerase I-like protein with 3'-5' exonuclease and polymerase domains